jgi:hypothetical protein
VEKFNMNKQKRAFLSGFSSVVAAGTAAVLFATRTWALPFDSQRKFPVAPEPSDRDPDQLGPNLGPKVDPSVILKHNSAQIHEDISKLYFLARELKVEVDRTVTESVLSMAMVQKCERIEKFAKQIKNLARGT